MARYIDANKLIKRLKETEIKSNRTGSLLKRFEQIVDEAPTEDVAPVVHAHWVLKKIFPSGIKHYECSKCGRTIYNPQNDNVKLYPYCHCGAKMDEVVNNG